MQEITRCAHLKTSRRRDLWARRRFRNVVPCDVIGKWGRKTLGRWSSHRDKAPLGSQQRSPVCTLPPHHQGQPRGQGTSLVLGMNEKGGKDVTSVCGCNAARRRVCGRGGVTPGNEKDSRDNEDGGRGTRSRARATTRPPPPRPNTQWHERASRAKKNFREIEPGRGNPQVPGVESSPPQLALPSPHNQPTARGGARLPRRVRPRSSHSPRRLCATAHPETHATRPARVDMSAKFEENHRLEAIIKQGTKDEDKQSGRRK